MKTLVWKIPKASVKWLRFCSSTIDLSFTPSLSLNYASLTSKYERQGGAAEDVSAHMFLPDIWHGYTTWPLTLWCLFKSHWTPLVLELVARRHDAGTKNIRRGGTAGSEEHRLDRWPAAQPGGGPEEQPVRGHSAQPQPQPHRPVRGSHPARRPESKASGQRAAVSPRICGLILQHLRKNFKKTKKSPRAHYSFKSVPRWL